MLWRIQGLKNRRFSSSARISSVQLLNFINFCSSSANTVRKSFALVKRLKSRLPFALGLRVIYTPAKSSPVVISKYGNVLSSSRSELYAGWMSFIYPRLLEHRVNFCFRLDVIHRLDLIEHLDNSACAIPLYRCSAGSSLLPANANFSPCRYTGPRLWPLS